jgi:hypothetical protein
LAAKPNPDLLAWVQSGIAPAETVVWRDKIAFQLPDRRSLPA